MLLLLSRCIYSKKAFFLYLIRCSYIIRFRSSLFMMNYLDFNDEMTNENSNLPTTSVVVNQQNKDLSDWRNIQLETTPTMFDRLWMPTTVNPWLTPNTPIYPSPYNQQIPSTYQWTNSNNNQSWPMPNFPVNPGLPLINFNSPQQNFLQTDTTNDIIDLTINPSTPIRFVICQIISFNRFSFQRFYSCSTNSN